MGYATPVEASALGALGALVLVIISGNFTVSTMYKAFYETVLVTGMLALIVMGAQVFGYFVSLSNISQDLMAFILALDRKSTRLNSSHVRISYAVFCLKKKKKSL